MLTLLVSLAAAQVADIALEPEGCYGDVLYPVPAVDAVDVPLDIAPRFYMEGECPNLDVRVYAEGELLVASEVALTWPAWGTVAVATPESALAPETSYTVVVTPEFGTVQSWSFTTGTAVSTPAPTPTFSIEQEQTWCSGREPAYSYAVSLDEDLGDGLVGYAAADPSGTWTPLVGDAGSTRAWLTTDPGALDELCASVALFEADGTLGSWAFDCADAPAAENCRRGLFGGCNNDTPVAVASNAGLFLPFLFLFGLRRRRSC